MKGSLRRIVLAGDPVARGTAHGSAYADEIRRYTAERVRLACDGTWGSRPTTRQDVLHLAERMLPAHERYAPDLFAEMVAMADAAGITPAEAVIVGGFTDFVDAVRAIGSAPEEDGCTSALVPGAVAEDGAMYAQTWDMHDTATEHVVLLDLRPDDGPAALVFTTVGCVAQIGMNAAGIAIGIDNLTMADGCAGVTWPFVVRKALQQTTYDEALAAILDAELAGGHAYLLLDGEGHGAMIEASSTYVAVTPLADRPLAHTNHALDPNVAAREAPRAGPLLASSKDRLARARELLTGPIDLERLAALTRDPTICRRAASPYHIETSGAVIARPRTRELWAVWGAPADAPYERFVVGGPDAG